MARGDLVCIQRPLTSTSRARWGLRQARLRQFRQLMQAVQAQCLANPNPLTKRKCDVCDVCDVESVWWSKTIQGSRDCALLLLTNCPKCLFSMQLPGRVALDQRSRPCIARHGIGETRSASDYDGVPPMGFCCRSLAFAQPQAYFAPHGLQ